MIRSIPTAWTYVATSRQVGLRDVKGAEEWPQSSGKSSSTRSAPRWINSCPSYSRRWVVGQFEPGRGKREASRSTLGLPLSVSLFAPRVLIGGVVALEEVRNGARIADPASVQPGRASGPKRTRAAQNSIGKSGRPRNLFRPRHPVDPADTSLYTLRHLHFPGRSPPRPGGKPDARHAHDHALARPAPRHAGPRPPLAVRGDVLAPDAGPDRSAAAPPP